MGAPKHGMANSSEYRVWSAMLQRCTNPKNKGYDNYGKRGITVYAAWFDFRNFIRDMGKRPTPKHSIERLENDGNYEPSNCIWATRDEQEANKRTTRWITVFGKRRKLIELSRESGISSMAIISRLKMGWSPEDAITRPLTQNIGRPRGSKDIVFEVNGEPYTIAEAADEFGLPEQTVRERLRRGFPITNVIAAGHLPNAGNDNLRNMSPEERSRIGKLAAEARWGKKRASTAK